MGNKSSKNKYSNKKSNNYNHSSSKKNQATKFRLNDIEPFEANIDFYDFNAPRKDYTAKEEVVAKIEVEKDNFLGINEWLSENNRVGIQFAEFTIKYDNKLKVFVGNKFSYGDYYDKDENCFGKGIKEAINQAFLINTDLNLDFLEDRLKNNKESLVFGYDVCKLCRNKYTVALNKDYGKYDSLTFSESSDKSIENALVKLNERFALKEKIANDDLSKDVSFEEN